jgi:hypothetical protein
MYLKLLILQICSLALPTLEGICDAAPNSLEDDFRVLGTRLLEASGDTNLEAVACHASPLGEGVCPAGTLLGGTFFSFRKRDSDAGTWCRDEAGKWWGLRVPNNLEEPCNLTLWVPDDRPAPDPIRKMSASRRKKLTQRCMSFPVGPQMGACPPGLIVGFTLNDRSTYWGGVWNGEGKYWLSNKPREMRRQIRKGRRYPVSDFKWFPVLKAALLANPTLCHERYAKSLVRDAWYSVDVARRIGIPEECLGKRGDPMAPSSEQPAPSNPGPPAPP